MGNEDFLKMIEKSYVPAGEIINGIVERYLHLLGECVRNRPLREAFEDDPRFFLVNFVRMRIPEDAMVQLDPHGTRWPVARFLKDDGEVEYTEGSLSVLESKFFESGMSDVKLEMRDEKCRVTENVPMTRDDCNQIIITMPYFTAETDLLTEYQFEGAEEAEIVLSSC